MSEQHATATHITRLIEMAEEVASMAEYYRAQLDGMPFDRQHPLTNAVSVLGGEVAGLKMAACWLWLVEKEKHNAMS